MEKVSTQKGLKMAEKSKGVSTPVRQEDLWTEVRFAAVRIKTWQGQEVKKNGLTQYRVQILVILNRAERSYGNSGDYLSVSVPMTEEDFTKLSNEKEGSLIHFEELKQHYYDDKISYSAKSVAPVRSGNSIPLPKA